MRVRPVAARLTGVLREAHHRQHRHASHANGQSNGAKLKELLAPYRPGGCPVAVVYSNQGAQCELRLGEDWRVNPTDGLVASLAAWVSEDNVKVVYQ